MPTTTSRSMTDWQPYEYALSWLERVRTLLEDSGGWSETDRRLINQNASDLLVMATTPIEPALVIQTTPQDQTPTPSARTRVRANPKVAKNGHPQPSRTGVQSQEPRQWSLNERLKELGYPEDLDRGTRIKLGQATVERYKEEHGKAPPMADHGRGNHATRVSLYVEADLPMVDQVIFALLGEPPRPTDDGDDE